MTQPGKDEKLMAALMGKLYQILTGGDETVPKAKNNFIAWCAPGIPFAEEDLAFATKGIAGKTGDESRQLLAQAADFSRLVNLIPDASGVYDKQKQQTTFENDGRNLWNVYSDVLKFSEVASSELTPDQQDKIKKFRSLLTTTKKVKDLITDEEKEVPEDGPILKAYNQAMSNYDDAVTEYNNKRISAMNSDNSMLVQDWALNASTYRRRVKTAMDAWTSSGYKNDVEQMQAFIAQVTQRDMTLLKGDLEDKFAKAILTDLVSGDEFYMTSFLPGNFAQNKNGWTKFDFTEANVSQYERSETNGWDVGVSVRYGLFGGSFSSTGEIGSTQASLDTSDFKMSFSLAQVPISRPWFSPEFLVNTAWRFAGHQSGRKLSNGAKPPEGELVAYPTTAIFVRDVIIDFKELHKNESTYTQSIGTKASVSYGPFSLNASYNRSVGERKFNSKMGSQGLEVPGLQLIGFKCAILPMSPNPNAAVQKWQ